MPIIYKKENIFRTGNEDDHFLSICLWNFRCLCLWVSKRLAHKTDWAKYFPSPDCHNLFYDDSCAGFDFSGIKQPSCCSGYPDFSSFFCSASNRHLVFHLVDIGGDSSATLAGIMNFVGQTGAFAMSVIFGKIVDFTHSFDAPQFVMIGILIIGRLCWLFIDASKKIN